MMGTIYIVVYSTEFKVTNFIKMEETITVCVRFEAQTTNLD